MLEGMGSINDGESLKVVVFVGVKGACPTGSGTRRTSVAPRVPKAIRLMLAKVSFNFTQVKKGIHMKSQQE
jgi:hypothetical protein